MLKVTIVEDEPSEAERLVSFLRRFEAENAVRFEIETYTSALTFLANYKKTADLVFMDIELPDVNGMEICRRLRKTDSEVAIVFVTNMAQFAVKGYEVNAVDFIVKPVQYTEFAVKVKKTVDFINRRSGSFVVLSYNGGLKRLNVNEIKYVEVMAHLVVYHTERGNIEITGSLKAAEETLEKYYFVRCNNCYLVNLRCVSEIRDSTAVLGDGEELQISRNKRKAFLQALANYYGGGG